MKENFKNPNAEGIRLRCLYRKLILEGKVTLPYRALKGLIGPDCAYHLYKFDSEKRSGIINFNDKNLTEE